MTNKKQRRLETAFLASLFYPRTFIMVMDSVTKIGLNEGCFQFADTRSAWLGVMALYKNMGAKWRVAKVSDDVAIRLAVEETLKREELEHARPENFSYVSVDDLAVTLVVSAEKYGFKQTLDNAIKTIDNCADVQTAVIMARQAINRWENTELLHNSAVDITAVADELNRSHKEAHAIKQGGGVVPTRGLPLPWGILNNCYQGLANGLHIVAARPSEGKTGYAINVSAFWHKLGVKHAFISLDMPIDETVKRYGCLELEQSDKHMSQGYASREQIAQYYEAVKAYKRTTFLYANPAMSAVEMAIRESVHNGARAVIIDFLQLVQIKGVKKWDAIQTSTGILKDLTRELKIPITVLAQLNRQGVKEGREPELHDIEGGGFIEQAASTVLTMARDKTVCDSWRVNPPLKLAGTEPKLAPWIRPVWLDLKKNQTGPIGKFPFVMYCPFYILRPANDVFDTINDDCKRLRLDIVKTTQEELINE